MIRVQVGARPEDVRQSAGHTLYVEGHGPDAIDPQVLGILLDRTGVRVEPMGPSSYIRAAAEALHPHHPNYYFLVDRDHRNSAEVEKTWADFPDVTSHNLLIWRRRELENYFLIPEYLLGSQYVQCDEAQLREVITAAAGQRIWMDVANHVITELREELKANWISAHTDAARFGSRADALATLLAAPEFSSHKRRVSQKLRLDLIENAFERHADRFCGGVHPLDFAHGEWHSVIKGKAVLPTIIHQCFRVRDTSGRRVQGREAMMAVVKELIRKPLDEQPDDFQELHQLVEARVQS